VAASTSKSFACSAFENVQSLTATLTRLSDAYSALSGPLNEKCDKDDDDDGTPVRTKEENNAILSEVLFSLLFFWVLRNSHGIAH
jgi:hypothetical protein